VIVKAPLCRKTSALYHTLSETGVVHTAESLVAMVALLTTAPVSFSVTNITLSAPVRGWVGDPAWSIVVIALPDVALGLLALLQAARRMQATSRPVMPLTKSNAVPSTSRLTRLHSNPSTVSSLAPRIQEQIAEEYAST